jgi:hypothetical protein
MEGHIWKARIDTALANAGRDIGDALRQAKAYISGLDATERLILIGLATIGLFYLLFSHVARRRGGEPAEGRFVGLLFVMVAFAAGIGWMMAPSGLRA